MGANRERQTVSVTGERAGIDQAPTMEQETAQITCSQNGCNVNRGKVAGECFLPEYPKEILEMGLR